MSQSHKTKEEILQELESIKGLLLEEDDIPLLQELEHQLIEELSGHKTAETQNPEALASEAQKETEQPFAVSRAPYALPGQGALFDEPLDPEIFHGPTEPALKNPSIGASANIATSQRPTPKAIGENPFLPQHIRARLHGNNPPPLYDFTSDTKTSTLGKTKDIKPNPSRQQLIKDVVTTLMPQIEQELKHRLYSMSVSDLEKLLEDED